MKITKYLNASTIILDLYITFVWCAYICVFVTDQRGYLLVLMLLMAIGAYPVLYFLTNKIKVASLKPERSLGKKENRKAFFICFLASFLVLLIWYIALFPGTFTADCDYIDEAGRKFLFAFRYLPMTLERCYF